MAASAAHAHAQCSPKAEEIILRTNELLATGGYNGFSFADIAERVAVRKASIHHHFPTKAALVTATVARHRQATLRGLQSLDQQHADPLQRLTAYTRYWAECIQASNPPICICALLAAELPAVPAEVADEVKAHFQGLHAWIAATMTEGVAKGSMRLTGETSTEAAVFMAAIHGAMLSARAAGAAALFAQIAGQAVDRLKRA